MIVTEWGKFERNDIQMNDIHEARNHVAEPNFVTQFEQMLERKSYLSSVRCSVDLLICCSILMGQQRS